MSAESKASIERFAVRSTNSAVERPGSRLYRTFARGASAAVITRIVGALASIGLYLTFTRILGAKEFGEYAFVMGLVVIFGTVADLGFATSTVRFLSEYRATNAWSQMAGFLRRSSRLTWAGALVAAIPCALMIWLNPHHLSTGSLLPMLLAVGLLATLSRVNLLSAQLRSFNLIWQANLPGMILRPLLAMAGLGGCALLLRAPSAIAGLAVQLFVSLILLGILAWTACSARPAELRSQQAQSLDPSWLRVSLLLLLISSASILIARTDIVMLGILVGTEDSGIYTVSSELSNVVAFTLQAINLAAAPLFAELYAKGQRTELERIVRWTGLAGLLGGLLVTIPLVVFGREILGFFGTEFAEGNTALLFLCAGQLVNAATGPVGLLLSMTGHEKQMALIMGVAAVGNILLNVLLIPAFGMTGAALATVIATVTWNVALLVMVTVHLRIRATPLAPGWLLGRGRSA